MSISVEHAETRARTRRKLHGRARDFKNLSLQFGTICSVTGRGGFGGVAVIYIPVTAIKSRGTFIKDMRAHDSR
jgi:hypothetical protein